LDDNLVQYWERSISEFQIVSPQNLWRRHNDALHGELLKHWLRGLNGQRLLKTDLFEEAYGEGLYPHLTLNGNHLMGMDISGHPIAKAKDRYPKITAVRTDVRHLPFSDESFGGIVSISTLDHFFSRQDLRGSLGEIYRTLKPQGQLLITLDNPVNPVIALRQALPFDLLHRLRLCPCFTGETLSPVLLRLTLEELGFIVLEVGAILHCPRVLAIPLAGLLERYCSRNLQKHCLKFLRVWEGLGSWPTRFITGHFITARAIRP
jgi:SAM-dependent methyltransferase